jgi:GT2 family glycosyltransferase
MLEDVALDGDYFCEDFFLYGDDQDLGWRARLRDWQCWYTPDAVGYHAGFGSGGIRLFRVQVQFTRNRYLTLARNDRFRDVLVDLPYLLLYELIQQAYWLARSPRRVFAHWLGLLEALRALPHTLKARRQIQRRRTASPQAIRSFVVSRLW